jgi:hypothetical protein
MEKASPSHSRSESLSRGGWLRSKARVAPSFERLGVVDAGLGESFNSSTASFIDMDPAELFSMRWTSDDTALDLGLPLLAAGDLLPCETSGIAHADGGNAYADAVSSPAFHTAQSTPASVSSGSPGASKRRTAPLLATRRLVLRYLRFLVPLCRKARSADRALAKTTTPARRSTSSVSSVAAEHWCHGNADTAVRDAILYCKKSFTDRAEC